MIDYRWTSREAWDSIEGEISGALDRDIMNDLRQYPYSTCEAIEERIGRTHQSVSGNLRHLVERGFVEASGLVGLTSRGRRAILWVLVPPPSPPLTEGTQHAL